VAAQLGIGRPTLHHLLAGGDEDPIVGDADYLHRVREVRVCEGRHDLRAEPRRPPLARHMGCLLVKDQPPSQEGLFFRCDLSALRQNVRWRGTQVAQFIGFLEAGRPQIDLRRARCLVSTSVSSKPHSLAAIMTHALRVSVTTQK